MVIEFADATDRIIITIPRFQLQNVDDGDRDGIRTDPIAFSANRESVGDDEITIEFTAA